MSLWKPGQEQQLTADELTAIQAANLGSGDTVAKISDIPSIPAAQLTSDELTAIQAANLGSGDTVAKVSDIPTGTTDRTIIIYNLLGV